MFSLRTAYVGTSCRAMTQFKTLGTNGAIVQTVQKRIYSTPTIEQVRKLRPVSPHLTIYEPQLTWVMSIMTRFTGGGLAAGLYGAGIWYSVAPFSSTTLLTAVSSLPLPVLFLSKCVLAYPFAFHTLNGVRHLFWDAGYLLSLKNVYTSGWIVNIASVLGTIGLVGFQS